VIALLADNCTVCMLCARECPDWCLYIESHQETVQPEGGGRPRQVHVLDRFAIDFGLCMYCGICVEVCPFDALFWAPTFDYATRGLAELLHEQERLGGWLDSVPPGTIPGRPDVVGGERDRRSASGTDRPTPDPSGSD
jgi:NADH-quinone oxidoreductase subunit I